MSAEQYYNGGGQPQGGPNRGYNQYNGPQQGYGGPQQGYGAPQQGYGGPQQQYYPQQQQQPVYVQHPQEKRGGGGDCCCGICLGCLALFACEELCAAFV